MLAGRGGISLCVCGLWISHRAAVCQLSHATQQGVPLPVRACPPCVLAAASARQFTGGAGCHRTRRTPRSMRGLEPVPHTRSEITRRRRCTNDQCGDPASYPILSILGTRHHRRRRHALPQHDSALSLPALLFYSILVRAAAQGHPRRTRASCCTGRCPVHVSWAGVRYMCPGQVSCE